MQESGPEQAVSGMKGATHFSSHPVLQSAERKHFQCQGLDSSVVFDAARHWLL